jgi:endonuclease/exonuclease/phosphatase family metal-dependent hydrolase
MNKHHSLSKFAIIMLVLVFMQAACEIPENAESKNGSINSLSIMTWNMQALFDGIDDGNEYDDYRASTGWSAEKYQGRITAISASLGSMTSVPDIIAIQEIESERVIGDLAAALSGRGFLWTHFANSPDMALGVGILSRYPFIDTTSHCININGDASPRPVLEVKINTDNSGAGNAAAGKSLVFFICHWKSKLGGDAITEEARRASARIILRRMRELAEKEPGLPVIVIGDLNENYDEFYRRNGEAVCALLPDDPKAAELAGFKNDIEINELLCRELQKDFLIISKSKPPKARFFAGNPIVMYSPWADELENGSYFYKNDWETIDHFLLSHQLFDNYAWEYDTCTVIDYPPFASAAGRPVSYNPRTGSGLSDHLPLLLALKWGAGDVQY